MSYRDAVAQTQAYSAFFSFPLRPEETHRWLISDKKISITTLKPYLSNLSPKNEKKRLQLTQNTLTKEKIALNFVNLVHFLPGIEMIALTGSVAVGNTHTGDDIDLLIVTTPHTLWLVRPFLLLLLTCKFHRRHPGDNPRQIQNSFCPNLWLDTQSLTIPKAKQNLYTAHEVLQIKPLFDRGGVYSRFLRANRWTGHFLANAYFELSTKAVSSPRPRSSSSLLAPLNLFSFLLQYLYMLPKKTTETVTLHSAFFHKNNLSSVITRHLENNCL